MKRNRAVWGTLALLLGLALVPGSVRVARADAEGRDLVRDASGNVYVVGGQWHQYGAFYAAKYSPTGRQLWSWTAPFGKTAWFAAVDSTGKYLYVTGFTNSPEDVATVKLDAARGVPSSTWPDTGRGVGVRRYDGPTSVNDAPHGIAADASGGVWIMVWSSALASPYYRDWSIVHYDAAGVMRQAWYDSPNQGNDWPAGIAADAAGDAYVTGVAGTVPATCRTAKYDHLTGAELWAASTPGPAGLGASGGAIALDGTGNVYAGGGTADIGTDGSELGCTLVTKYTSSGTELWSRVYDAPGQPDGACAAASAFDGGSLFIAGPGGSGIQTRRCDVDGNPLYLANLAANAGVQIVAAGGFVYVTGGLTTIKYRASDLTVSTTWPDVGYGVGVRAQTGQLWRTAADAAGNFYVTASGWIARTYACTTRKYGQNGALLWSVVCK